MDEVKDLKAEMERMRVTSPKSKPEMDKLRLYHPPTPIPQSKTDVPSPAIVISSVHLKLSSRRSYKEHFISTSY